MKASKTWASKDEPFPVKLRELMTDRGVTQQALADAIGVKRQTISAYADGGADPTLPKLCAMADFFDISIDSLTGRHECTSPENEEISKRLGLTEGAIKRLESNYNTGMFTFANAYPPLISGLIETEAGRELLTLINTYVFADFAKVYDVKDDEGEGIEHIILKASKAAEIQNSGYIIRSIELADMFLIKISSELKHFRKFIQTGEYHSARIHEKLPAGAKGMADTGEEELHVNTENPE